MKTLLDKAASLSAGEFPKLIKCSWPLGRVRLHEDRLWLDACAEQYELLYSDIEHFQFNLFQVNITHHDPKVTRDISINGFFISRAIRKAIAEHHLPIKML